MFYIEKSEIKNVTIYGDYCISKCINDLWHYDGHWYPFTEKEIEEYKARARERLEKKYQLAQYR